MARRISDANVAAENHEEINAKTERRKGRPDKQGSILLGVFAPWRLCVKFLLDLLLLEN